MSKKLEESILNEIEKTGYPFELQVSKYFSANSWSVAHNSYYIDKDEGKGREIDLIAGTHRQNPGGEYYFELNWDLVTEIKQSLKKPWIIFTTEVSNFEKLLGFPNIRATTNFSTPYHKIHKVFRNQGTKLNGKVGRSFYEAMAGNNKRDNIYKALSGAAKATSHLVESRSNDQSSDRLFYYHEPIIVLNGNLFEAFLNEDNIMEVGQVDYTQVAFNYLSPNYDSERYIIQIVTLDYLPQFIKQTEEKVDAIYQKILDIETQHLSEGKTEKK